VKFDAAAWVALAKQAGMKYIVLTTKHHDGFSMFKSRWTGLQRGGRHAVQTGRHP